MFFVVLAWDKPGQSDLRAHEAYVGAERCSLIVVEAAVAGAAR